MLELFKTDLCSIVIMEERDYLGQCMIYEVGLALLIINNMKAYNQVRPTFCEELLEPAPCTFYVSLNSAFKLP